ncbi:Transposable element Tcb2 transposase [Anthophora quadrimaculata]
MPRRVVTKLIQDAGISISDMIVRQRLKSLDFEVRRPVKKPKLTETVKKKRLQWGKQYRNWTTEDWEKVCFSDESICPLKFLWTKVHLCVEEKEKNITQTVSLKESNIL